MSATSFHAAWIFPISQPPIRDGYCTVENGQVTDFGAKPTSGATIIDLGDTAILPRPVNAHTHLEFSDLTQPLGHRGMNFAAWIGEVLAQRSSRSAPKSQSIELGLRELEAALTGTVGEIATLPSAAEDYGRSTLPGVTFHELLSTDLDRGLARLSEITGLADNWHADLPLHFGLSPHAPYTVHWELFNKAVDLAAQRNWPVAMHLGESLDEMELLRSHSGKLHQLLIDRGVWNPSGLPRGIGLADYLRKLLEAPVALAIHGNFFGDEEYEILARCHERMSLVVCPRTCDYFLPSLPPIAELLAKSVHVALGTDSRATNPDLNIWNEAKFLLSKPTGLAPSQVLRMVTLQGAEALGLQDRCGQIELGTKIASLATVEIPTREENPELAATQMILAELRAFPD